MTAIAFRTKVWVEVGGRFALGEGALALFQGLDRFGNLTRAAGEIGWSYRHAWGYVRRAERALGCQLTVTTPGKGPRRGTCLTPAARAILEQLAEARTRVRAALGEATAQGPTSAAGRPRCVAALERTPTVER